MSLVLVLANLATIAISLWLVYITRVMRVEDAKHKQRMATLTTPPGPVEPTSPSAAEREALLPPVVAYDGRPANGQTVWLGQAVSDDGYHVEDLTLSLNARLSVFGQGRYDVGRAVTAQWSQRAGHGWMLLDETGDGVAELWGPGCSDVVVGAGVAGQLTALRDLVVERYDLLHKHGVTQLEALPEDARPDRLLVILNVGDGQTGDDLRDGERVWRGDAGKLERLGAAAGIHLMVLAGNPWYAQVAWVSVALTARLLLGHTGGGALYQAGMTGATPPAQSGTPRRGLWGMPLQEARFVQAATCPARPLPNGWSVEDLTLAVSAGLSPAEIAGMGPPNDVQREAFAMLAGLRR